MSDQEFPQGWDNERVKRLLAHYENVSDDEQVAEDEKAADEHPGQTLVSVPSELLPAIRSLLATHQNG